MSAAQLSDVQLDRLLGQVAAPAAPAPDLAQRIAARAVATPQNRARLFAISPRHRPRRRHVIMSSVIAANFLAAAAAATSWDGERFDFRRIAEIPHRVAAAIHRHRYPHEKVEVAQAHPRASPKAAPIIAPVAKAPAAAPVTPPIPLRARMMPMRPAAPSAGSERVFNGFNRMHGRPAIRSHSYPPPHRARATRGELRVIEPKQPRLAERRQAEPGPLAERTPLPAGQEARRLQQWQRSPAPARLEQDPQQNAAVETPAVQKPAAERPAQPAAEARPHDEPQQQRLGQFRRGQRGRWRPWPQRPHAGRGGRRRGF